MVGYGDNSCVHFSNCFIMSFNILGIVLLMIRTLLEHNIPLSPLKILFLFPFLLHLFHQHFVGKIPVGELLDGEFCE